MKKKIKAWEKAGFQHEGILRDAVKDQDTFANDVLMAILEDEWRCKSNEETL